MSESPLKQIIKLSFPIILGQLGQMLIVAGDVYVATKHSTHAVAAIGVAGGIINPIFLFGIGMTMGVSPSFAFLRGKGQNPNQQANSIFIYSLILGFIITFSMLILNQFVHLLGIEESLLPDLKQYISIVSWSFPLAIVFGGLREFLQSFEEVMIPNIMAMAAVVFNIIVNLILVFGIGEWGGMGTVGLAYASVSVRVVLFMAIMYYTFKRYAFVKPDWLVIKTLTRFSLPIAFMFFLEVLAFCTVTILSGKLGVVPAATNNIIMTLASIAFMIPLSMSSAAAVKIGFTHGTGDIPLMRQYLKAILILIIGFCLFSIFTFVVFPSYIMNFMTEDLAVIELGIQLLLIVAIFQVFDAFQVTLAGVLRGLGETRFPSWMVFLGYWIIGIPTGIFLTFKRGMGAEGLWIGLAVSLGVVAVSLSVFTYKKMKSLV